MLRLLPTFSVGMMSRGLTGRGYTTSPVKASVALVAKLRKETSIPMSKARQALIQHNNDYEATLKWIQEQEVSAGEDKAAKLEGREVKDGLLGVVSHQGKGAMIELGCETDFVARNPSFRMLTERIAITALHLDLEQGGEKLLENAPLLPHPMEQEKGEGGIEEVRTVGEEVSALIGRVGEKVKVRRWARLDLGQEEKKKGGFMVSRTHGGEGGSGGMSGRMGVLVHGIGDEAGKKGSVTMQVAQHILGMGPKGVEGEEGLLGQEYLFGGGSVQEILGKEGIEVDGFMRWQVGEELSREKREE
ncbi:MAG: elongation factor TS-domain-containing protein [Piptocephalis tieghemiana]|nr:MAG: elongation factor TS-domain-containing protein [Piptocephalis tieghemiana]